MERFRRRTDPPTLEARIGANDNGREERNRPSMSRVAATFHNRVRATVKRMGGRREDRAKKGDRKSSFLDCFLRLPNELHAQILCELSISDILALRRTCHVLYELVSKCASQIVRFWVKYRFGSLHVKLYPPPAPGEAHLHYLLAMRRRHIACVRLTYHLTDFVRKDTTKNACPKRRQIWKSVYDTMLPLVFAVGYFLEEHRRLLLQRDLGEKQNPAQGCYDIRITPPIADEERGILRQLDPAMHLQYFYMYCFIIQVLKRKLRPPKSAGTVEKLVRGWTTAPVCPEDIAFVVILGGISRVAKILACKNYNERRRFLHTFATRLTPYECAEWKENWKALGIDSATFSLDDIPKASIGITQLDGIFVPLMESCLESREYTDAQRLRFAQVKRERKFVNELMGYDIWGQRGRPPGAEDSDGDDASEL